MDFLLNKSIYQQFASFYHGFHSVCASNALIVSLVLQLIQYNNDDGDDDDDDDDGDDDDDVGDDDADGDGDDVGGVGVEYAYFYLVFHRVCASYDVFVCLVLHYFLFYYDVGDDDDDKIWLNLYRTMGDLACYVNCCLLLQYNMMMIMVVTITMIRNDWLRLFYTALVAI